MLSGGDFPTAFSTLTHIKYSTYGEGVGVTQIFARNSDYVRSCMIRRSNLVNKEIFSSPETSTTTPGPT
jgi:hypothetical protein